MKATCIIGSPHLDGSTARLAESLLSGLRDSGVQTVRYCVGQCRIHYCLGCKVCYETGRCVQSDGICPGKSPWPREHKMRKAPPFSTEASFLFHSFLYLNTMSLLAI